MLEAYDVMMQASMTAKTWAREAKSFVEDEFSEYPPASRATIIAAYMNAAAGDEVAMHVRSLVDMVGPISESLDGLQDSLRSDHPLQSETFGGLRDALQAIADNIGEAGTVAALILERSKAFDL